MASIPIHTVACRSCSCVSAASTACASSPTATRSASVSNEMHDILSCISRSRTTHHSVPVSVECFRVHRQTRATVPRVPEWHSALGSEGASLQRHTEPQRRRRTATMAPRNGSRCTAHHGGSARTRQRRPASERAQSPYCLLRAALSRAKRPPRRVAAAPANRRRTPVSGARGSRGWELGTRAKPSRAARSTVSAGTTRQLVSGYCSENTVSESDERMNERTDERESHVLGGARM